jgi:hypothetical protein
LCYVLEQGWNAHAHYFADRCHVLAHESFENEDIAKIKNEGFVNIKVDREERPDVDRLYMAYLQVSGSASPDIPDFSPLPLGIGLSYWVHFRPIETRSSGAESDIITIGYSGWWRMAYVYLYI